MMTIHEIAAAGTTLDGDEIRRGVPYRGAWASIDEVEAFLRGEDR